VLIIESDHTFGDDAADVGISVFVAAFLSLLLAAFLYGTAAGQELITTRAGLITLVSGVALGIGVMDLLAGVVWLVASRDAVADLVARVVAAALPLVSLAYFAYTISNIDRLSSGAGPIDTRPDIVLLLCSLAILGLFLLALEVLWKRPVLNGMFERAAGRRATIIRVVTVSSIVVSVVMAVAAGGLLEEPPRYDVGAWVFDVSAGVLLVMGALFACFIRLLVHRSGRPG
jgi:hypothetical protein